MRDTEHGGVGTTTKTVCILGPFYCATWLFCRVSDSAEGRQARVGIRLGLYNTWDVLSKAFVFYEIILAFLLIFYKGILQEFSEALL